MRLAGRLVARMVTSEFKRARKVRPDAYTTGQLGGYPLGEKGSGLAVGLLRSDLLREALAPLNQLRSCSIKDAWLET